MLAWAILAFSTNHLLLRHFPNSYENLYFILLLTLIISSWILYRKITHIEKKNEKDFKKYEKWLTWEQEVAYRLGLIQGKENDFYVVNDFQLEEWRKRNIDHIVISKKWIFALETKNISYIKNHWIDEQKTAKKEAWELRNILLEKFNIKWVNPIFVFIDSQNKQFINKLDKCETLYYRDLEKYFDTLIHNQNIENPREIYEYLLSLQQKKS